MNNPFDTLGIAAGATLLEAERAVQKLRELYAEDSLAIYALLTEEQRHKRLVAIEAAYQQIVAGRSAQEPISAPVVVAAVPPLPLNGPPDPQLAPGAYLRWKRLQSGKDLKDLAERTKLQPSRLEHIETERFSQLPPAVYLRGFIAEYARCLGVAEPRQLAEAYLRRMPQRDDDF